LVYIVNNKFIYPGVAKGVFAAANRTGAF